MMVDATTSYSQSQARPQMDTSIGVSSRKTAQAYRRRTLQSISELSSSKHFQNQANPNGVHHGASSDDDYPTIYDNRGQMRPQSIGSSRYLQPKPSITITSADSPPSHRSSATSFDVGSRAPQTSYALRQATELASPTRPNANLPSDGKTVEKRESVDAKQRRRSAPIVRSMLSPRNASSGGGQMQTKADILSGQSKMMVEAQASSNTTRTPGMIDGKTRRRNGHSISLGSSAALPSLSPFPAKPTPAHLRGQTSQHQLLQNSRTVSNGIPTKASNRRLSSGRLNQQTERDIADAQILKRASTNSLSVGKRASNPTLLDQAASPKAPYSASNSRRSSRLSLQHSPMPPLPDYPLPMSQSGTQSPTQHDFARPPSRTFAEYRQSRSTTPTQSAKVRTSSAHSATSAASSKSNISRFSQKSKQSSTSRSSRRSRRYPHEVEQEHLDALAALTAPAPAPAARMTPESLRLLESQKQILDERIRRQSAASERALRISQARERSHGSRPGSRVSQHTYGSDIIDGAMSEKEAQLRGLTPESVRLLREREKLLRWKVEREKLEFEKREREKIRERVKRANEMEEARSRDMESKDKKKQKERRGCCGILGI